MITAQLPAVTVGRLRTDPRGGFRIVVDPHNPDSAIILRPQGEPLTADEAANVLDFLDALAAEKERRQGSTRSRIHKTLLGP